MSDITLSNDELQFMLNELANRDPVMRLLLMKQTEAQRQPSGPRLVPDEAPIGVAGGVA